MKHRTLSDRLLFAFPIVVLAILAGIALDVAMTVHEQSADATIVDLSGRQRMLNQKFLAEVLLASAGAKTDFLRTSRLLRDSALAMRDGGQAPDNHPGTQSIALPRARSPEIAARLTEQISLIAKAEEWVERNRDKNGALPSFDPEKQAEIVGINEALARAASDTIRLFVRDSQDRVTRTFLRNLLLITLLAGLGLWMGRLLSERKEREKALVAAKDAALAASRAKSEFLANMSHEIRTPLNAIVGMADLLTSTQLSREQARYVEAFKRASDTLLSVINDILDLSKIESGQLRLEPMDFDLVDLVERSAEMMSLRAHQKGLELICQLNPDVPRFAVGDAARIKEVLMNVLGNAVKFTNSGEITLRVEREPGDADPMRLRFTVQDSGIGIAKDKLDTIFDSFSQADSSIAYNYGGTGLGLTICRRLLTLMGGKIEVQSQPGAGSTFTFTLPLARSARRPESSDEVVPVDLAGKRILIVDDNSTNRFVLSKYLGMRPSAVDEAASGSAALELLRAAKAGNRPYDLILLDYRMPGMNGLQLAEIIERENLAANTVAMLLTSDGLHGDLHRLLETGISDYMLKPIRRADLFESISRALRRGTEPLGARRDPAAARMPETPPLPTIRKGLRILVVDDLPENRFIVGQFLHDLKPVLVEAGDGTEAIERYEAEPFDLVLMDLRMPRRDGYSATRAIRSWETKEGRGHTPIIALTAHALTEEIQRSLEAGCDVHLSKPITRVKLLEAISSALSLSARERKTPDVETGNGLIHVTVDPLLVHRAPAYLNDRRDDLVALRAALVAADFEKLARLGHNIAGNAGVYGFDELGAVAKKLEKTAEQNDTAGAAGLIDAMQDYLARVRID